MEYTRLGETGLEVSRLCLGCLNFGSEEEWMMNNRDASIELIDRALALGINFFDTANAYSGGESEAILGEAIQEHDREKLVIATKVFKQVGEGPNKQGLSRKHILDQIDASLDRLGTDYVDLYQIHRWDENTPIEETLAALDHLIWSGKVRYIGVSTMAGWQLSKALFTADREEYERFVCIQPEYNLVDRHEEANVLPICAEENLGVIPWSPLAGGFLAGKYDRESTVPDESRAATDAYTKQRFTTENWRVLEEVRTIAERKDATAAQISLAWLLQKPIVDAPIIGPRRIAHLEENVEALSVTLTDDEIKRLEAPIFPRWPVEEKD